MIGVIEAAASINGPWRVIKTPHKMTLPDGEIVQIGLLDKPGMYIGRIVFELSNSYWASLDVRRDADGRLTNDSDLEDAAVMLNLMQGSGAQPITDPSAVIALCDAIETAPSNAPYVQRAKSEMRWGPELRELLIGMASKGQMLYRVGE